MELPLKDRKGVLSVKNIKIEMGLKEFLSFSIRKKFKIIMVKNPTLVLWRLISYVKMIKINKTLLEIINELVVQAPPTKLDFFCYLSL